MFDLSVVIVNYNTRGLLQGCLESLYRQHPSLSFEAIVVDNGSKDGSATMVNQEFPQVDLIQNCSNLGFSKAANQAIKKSRGEYVLLLNPDTCVLPNSTEELVRFMDGHPEAGAAGPKLLYPDGTLQPTCRAFPRYSLLLFGRESLLTKLFPQNRFSRRYLLRDLDYSKVQEVDFVAGAAMMVRRSVLEEVGLLDEGFFLFAEDTDLCYRIKKKQWKIYFVPQALIIHHLGASIKREKGKAMIQHHKSFYRFLCKHYSPSPLMKAALRIALAFRIVALLALRSGERIS